MNKSPPKRSCKQTCMWFSTNPRVTTVTSQTEKDYTNPSRWKGAGVPEQSALQYPHYLALILHTNADSFGIRCLLISTYLNSFLLLSLIESVQVSTFLILPVESDLVKILQIVTSFARLLCIVFIHLQVIPSRLGYKFIEQREYVIF